MTGSSPTQLNCLGLPFLAGAAIAALHSEAPSAAATDWPQIVALYTNPAAGPTIRQARAPGAYRQYDPAAVAVHIELALPAARVACHVRQRLLSDPVDNQLHVGREVGQLVVDPARHLQPRALTEAITQDRTRALQPQIVERLRT
jgi:hypothetical protein